MRFVGRIAIVLSVLLSTIGLGGRIVDAAPKLDTPERRLAAAEFKRGKALYSANNYAAALEAFRKGFDAYPLRGFLVNIGQCHRRLGHLREAAAAYQQFLDGPDVAPALRAEVEEALVEVHEAQRNEPVEPTRPTRPVVAEEPKVEPAQPMLPPGEPAPVLATPQAEIVDAPREKKHRPKWVWALVGVGAAIVAGGVAVGVVLGTRSTMPSGGSLGLLDARHP